MAELELRGVSNLYSDKVRGVKNVDLKVEDGGFLVITGPDGGGKTTLLKLIAGLEKADEGEVLIGGEPAGDVRDRDIVMVFQNYALDSRATVYDNMAAGLKLRKIAPEVIDSRVKEAAAILNLTPMLQAKPKTLSGAQRQRVALGRAIVRRPKLFLFDEPLSHLDQKLRIQMRADIIKLYYKLSTTFIYSTSDQVEAMTLGARIAVIKDGVLQQTGTPQEIYDAPENTFVATYFGMPQMNMYPCDVRVDTDGVIFKADGFTIKLPGVIGRCAGEEKVWLGIRAEDVKCERAFIEASKNTAFSASVVSAEAIGNETLLYLKSGKDSVFMRTAAKLSVKEGDTVSAAFDPAHIHLFDFTTGEKLVDKEAAAKTGGGETENSDTAGDIKPQADE